MTDILVLYSSRGITREIAERIAARLIELGHRATAVRASDHAPPAASFDAVIVGAPMWFGRPRRTLANYIRTSRRELAEMATAFFTVGVPRHRAFSEYATAAERFFDDVAWQPGPVSELASSLRDRAHAWMRNMLQIDAVAAVASLAERSDAAAERPFHIGYPQDPNG